MDKKKLTSLIIIAVLVITACIGGVFAYMFRDTGYKDYDFINPIVECELFETTNNPLTQKESITVNSGDSNVNVYVRVRLVTYWVQYDGEGNAQVVGRPSGAINLTLNDDKWLAGSDNTYYYKTPVEPSATTENLIADGVIPLVIEDEIYYQVIDVFAEAIQAEPASAANEAWGVTIDSDGNISAAN